MHFTAAARANFVAVIFLSSSSLSFAQGVPQASWYVRGSAAALLDDAQGRLTQGNPASGIPGALYAQTPDFSTRNTGSLSLALGHQVAPNVSVELEIHRAKSRFDSTTLRGTGGRTVDTFSLSGAVRSTSLLVNGTYDFNAGAVSWQPYLKMGVGTTKHSSDANLSATINAMGVTVPTPNAFPSSRRSVMTWAMGAGVRYAISPDTSIDLGYRYLDMGTAKTGVDGFGDSVNTKMRAHEASVGLVYRF